MHNTFIVTRCFLVAAVLFWGTVNTSCLIVAAEPTSQLSAIEARLKNLQEEALSARLRGKIEEELSLRKQVLDLMSSHFKEDHYRSISERQTINSCEKILALPKERRDKIQSACRSLSTAFYFHEQGKLSRARDYYFEAHEQFQNELGDDSVYTVDALERLAIFQIHLNDVDKASQNIEALIKSSRVLLGNAHPTTANAIRLQGDIAFIRKNYNQAIKHLDEALAISTKCHRQLDYSHAQILISRAKVLNRLKKFEESRACAVEATSIVTVIAPVNMAALFAAQFELARCCYGEGKSEHCATIYYRLRPLMETHADAISMNGDYIELLTMIRDSLVKLGDSEEAERVGQQIAELTAKSGRT